VRVLLNPHADREMRSELDADPEGAALLSLELSADKCVLSRLSPCPRLTVAESAAGPNDIRRYNSRFQYSRKTSVVSAKNPQWESGNILTFDFPGDEQLVSQPSSAGANLLSAPPRAAEGVEQQVFVSTPDGKTAELALEIEVWDHDEYTCDLCLSLRVCLGGLAQPCTIWRVPREACDLTE
jgi:hypothetical protein